MRQRVYYKVSQLLQSMAEVYKVRQVLQSVTVIAELDVTHVTCQEENIFQPPKNSIMTRTKMCNYCVKKLNSKRRKIEFYFLQFTSILKIYGKYKLLSSKSSCSYFYVVMIDENIVNSRFVTDKVFLQKWKKSILFQTFAFFL